MSDPAAAAPTPYRPPAPLRGARLARLLVRLKLRLSANRAARSPLGRLLLPLSWLLGLGAGIVGLAAATGIGHTVDDQTARQILVLGASAFVVAWAIVPLGTVGVDETLDPSRLVLYPLRARSLTGGLLVAALVGPAPLAVVLCLVGVVIGFAAGPEVVVAVPAVLLVAALGVLVSRTLAAMLAGALNRSRRSRDLAVIVGAIAFAGLQLLRFVRLPSASDQRIDQAVDVARWTPTGMLGQAIVDARADRWLIAVIELLPAVLCVVALRWLWGRTLARSLTVVSGGSTSRRARRPEERALPLFPRLTPFLPPTAWGAVAARELRYVAREPRRKVATGMRAVLVIGGTIFLLVRAVHHPTHSVVLASALSGVVVVFGAWNMFGLDGAAAWFDVSAGNDVRDVLVGKDVALLVTGAPVWLVSAVVLAAFTGGWLYVPIAVPVAIAALGVSLAVANVVSVRAPMPVPEQSSPFGMGAFGSGGAGSGRGCATAVWAWFAFVVQSLMLVPVGLATAVGAVVPWTLVLVVPLVVAYGGWLWWLSLRLATRELWWRQPELLVAIDPVRGV